MHDLHDLAVVIESRIPLIVVETFEEGRVVDMLDRLAEEQAGPSGAKPLFTWSVTEGFRRINANMGGSQIHAANPRDALAQVRATKVASTYILLDFHPYLEEPINVRLLKEIALRHEQVGHTVVMVSHAIDIPRELKNLTARFTLTLPDDDALEAIVREEARSWREHSGVAVRTDRATLGLLVQNLRGLTASDARRLARGAIFDDGAITDSDLPKVQQTKYRLLEHGGVLSFEMDTAQMADVGGLRGMKRWLSLRQGAFLGDQTGLDTPRGVMLVGVQGAGKSLAAKAVAGAWALPLLRLDFGSLFSKYHGETERNLREALRTAEVMAPCVLWCDEIEKGVATDTSDSGTSRRVLGTLLTWMAEKSQRVFIVATANDIESLPPELVRKGRFDEIFFVDLPERDVRVDIFRIHLEKRGHEAVGFDLESLADASDGFSGAEIEQVVVSARYLAHEQEEDLADAHLHTEVECTKPLSVVMSEQIDRLRDWANDRTVPAD